MKSTSHVLTSWCWNKIASGTLAQSACEKHVSTWNLRGHSIIHSLDRDKIDVNLRAFWHQQFIVSFSLELNEWIFKKKHVLVFPLEYSNLNYTEKNTVITKYIETKNQMLVMRLHGKALISKLVSLHQCLKTKLVFHSQTNWFFTPDIQFYILVNISPPTSHQLFPVCLLHNPNSLYG